MTETAYFLITIPAEKATDQVVGQLHQMVRQYGGDLDFLGDFESVPRARDLEEALEQFRGHD